MLELMTHVDLVTLLELLGVLGSLALIGTTLHGKNAVIYMGDGAGAAVQIAEAADYTIDVDRDLDPDPALGDSWESKLKGLLRFNGSFNGNFDDAQDTIWDASVFDGSVPFYLYPTSAVATRYYYGNIFPVPSISGGTGARITFAVTFEGDGELAKNPA